MQSLLVEHCCWQVPLLALQTWPEGQSVSRQHWTQTWLQHTVPATQLTSVKHCTQVPVLVSHCEVAPLQQVGEPPGGVQTLLLSQQAPLMHVWLSPQANPRFPQTQLPDPSEVVQVLPLGQPHIAIVPYWQTLVAEQQVWSAPLLGTWAQTWLAAQQVRGPPSAVWQACVVGQQFGLPEESWVQVWLLEQQTAREVFPGQ